MAASVQSGCMSNCTRSGFLEHEWTAEELWAPWQVIGDYLEYQPWLFSLLGSAMIGLSGVFPLLVIPIDEAADLKHGESSKMLKILLSFAVGGLLGDVFLHLLPEAWANHAAAASATSAAGERKHAPMSCGLWVLCGFLVFVVAEKMFAKGDEEEEEEEEPADLKSTRKPQHQQQHENNNCAMPEKCEKLRNGYALEEVAKANGFGKEAQMNGVRNGIKANGVKLCNGLNGFAKRNGVKETAANGFCALRELQGHHGKELCQKKPIDEERTRERPKHITGYLNLMANCVDNFTHGLAVGGSFLVSFRLGALTTFAILIHEIPHEIGDFAILLRSGFNRWDAAKAQLMTATGGICGAFVAVISSGDAVESKTSWILPFTAGGFLHIGLVTIIPELVKETNPWESLKQMGALLTGVVVMAFLTIMCD